MGLALWFVLVAQDVGSQPAPPSRPNVWSRDGERAAWLEQHGRTTRRQHVIVIAPADSVSEEWQQAYADSLDRGVGAVRRLIGGPYPWQRIAQRPATPITFYVSPELFPAHGTGRDAVFLSLPRVQSGEAAALREVSHELLVPTCSAPTPCYPSPWERPDAVAAEVSGRFPNWLFWFGIAGYLAHTAADAEGLTEPRRFDGGLAGADRLCAERAAAHQVIALFPAARAGTWEREVERNAQVPMSELRTRWLRQLGLEPQRVH